ncbi:MAG: hypothetical protein F4Y86_01070 [Gammaproteobacteria bacterium]|nr:hypothetical protein [Gammaproteobacteria bacterium]
MIEQFAKYIPPKLLSESGKAFHAGRLAFSGQRNLYVLGLNPGGAPELHSGETVEDNFDLVLRRERPDWSSFVDEVWKHRGKALEPGEAALQRQMQEVLGCLGLDPREVPASDLVFVRSRQARDLGDATGLMEACWPFHDAVMKELGVWVVLCLYKQVAEFVRAKTGASPTPIAEVAQTSKSGKTIYRRECFRAPSGLMIVQITRPTGVPWTDNACALTNRALAVADRSPLGKRPTSHCNRRGAHRSELRVG